MSLKDAQKFLHDQVCSLPATGASGFEGFMAGVLSEFTGQAFHVVKSGHQQGSDVRSAPHNLFKIGLEGKRYGASTSLPLDSLLYKITDASRAYVPVDLWILATTCRVDASDREKLHEHGEALGIGVIVLDYSSDSAQLSDLLVICASSMNACNTFLEPSEQLINALKSIRQNSVFESRRSELHRRLTKADMGYESSRLACERWIKESLENAKSRVRGHHALLESQRGIIPRTSINNQLNDWYKSGHSIGALVGDEGMGKSWASLDWHNTLKLSKEGAPLTVFLAAKEIETSGVKPTLVKALAAQTDIRSVDFWVKRLALWERSSRVNILILLDGLNENFNFKQWSDWLQPLFEDNLGNMYRVIVSCWPNWWNESLFGLENLIPKPQVINVDRFNDSELDALLVAMNVKRSEFTDAVLELMRVPRLSSLVAKNRENLQKSGDITAERVIYEDWKDRLERRGPGTGLTEQEMKDFVARLGQKLKNDIDQMVTRKDVIQSLSDDSGKNSLELQPAITELTSGAWLIPGNKSNTFKVAADRIPFVLGATLVSQILEETEAEATETIIAEFLDPLNSHSLGASILRAATTIALIESEPSSVLGEILLSKWIDERNFYNDDFEAFWRLAGLDPNLFLDLAESRWLSQTGGVISDEVLSKALANAADFNDFQKALRARMIKWLATAWPDPRVGMFLEKIDQAKPDSKQRAANTLARYTEWSSSEAAKSFMTIIIDKHEGWSWLSHRALAVLSYLNCASYVEILKAWALSRAIMQCARHEEEVAWILRLDLEDAGKTRMAVMGIITEFKKKDNRICDQAVVYLERAMSHIKRASKPIAIEEEPKVVPTRLDVNGMDSSALYEAAKKIMISSAWRKYEPESTAALINALIERGLEQNEATMELILDNLLDFIAVLTPNSRNHLSAVIEIKQNSIKEDGKKSKQTAAKLKSAWLALRLFEAEPAKQASLLLSYGIGIEIDCWLPFCRLITSSDIEQMNLSNAPVGYLAGWLEYLGERLSEEEIAKLDFLPDLITHEDQGIREKALILAAFGRNMPALKVFVDSPFSEAASGEDKSNIKHEYWRHHALLESCEFSPDASLTMRMKQEHIALIANHKPADTKVLRQFNEYLKGEIEAISTENSWSRPRYMSSYRKAIRALVEYDMDSVLLWLEPWVESMNIRAERAVMNDFPIIDLMYELSGEAPEISLKLYNFLIDQLLGSPFFTDGILYFPFEVAESQYTDELCDKILADANTDKSLLEITYLAFRSNRQDWLFTKINSLEGSQNPVDVAKAYTLLGFCDECGDADEAWQNFLMRPPKDQWLERVIRSSINDYARNRAVRLALRDFWSAEKMWKARHALKCVEQTCDLRIWNWFSDISPEWNDRPYQHRLAMDMAEAGIKQKIKRDKESRKKKLFHTRIGYSNMSPWK